MPRTFCFWVFMSLDFSAVENKFKEVRDLSQFIDTLDFDRFS